MKINIKGVEREWVYTDCLSQFDFRHKQALMDRYHVLQLVERIE